jgi:hypothetical protein
MHLAVWGLRDNSWRNSTWKVKPIKQRRRPITERSVSSNGQPMPQNTTYKPVTGSLDEHEKLFDTSPYQGAFDMNREVDTTTLQLQKAPIRPIEYCVPMQRELSDSGTSVTDSVSEFSDTNSSQTSFRLGTSFTHIDLDAQKRALVETIMIQFMVFFSNCCRSSHTLLAAGDGGGEARGQGGEGESQSGSKNNLSLPNNQPKGKRKVHEIDDHGSEDQDGDGEPPRKYPKDKILEDINGTRKFACPYFKRNRRKYQKFRSCPGLGWDTVHRMK